jgi:hypothetical protein
LQEANQVRLQNFPELFRKIQAEDHGRLDDRKNNGKNALTLKTPISILNAKRGLPLHR